MDLTSQQTGERPKEAMGFKEKYPCCYVCKKPITQGQFYYAIKTNKFVRRHETCSRKKPGKEMHVQTEEQIREDLAASRPSGSDKRRRSGGHGYSGGDGFQDI